MIAAALLLYAQIADAPACTAFEPIAPQPSANVQKLLHDHSHEARWYYLNRLKEQRDAAKDEANKARENYEQALHEAQNAGDHVGEAQANFSLARLTYETNHKWPAAYIDASAASCKIAGCGPELVRALLRWAGAVGPKDSSYSRVVTAAFRIALEEPKRRRAMARELSDAILGYSDADLALQQRSRVIAAQLLETEIADATDRNDPVGEALAATQWGNILSSSNMPAKAADAYAKAAPLWKGAQCRLNEVDVLLRWAATATPPPVSASPKKTDTTSGDTSKLTELLKQALTGAEQEDKCQYAMNQLLSTHSYLWKPASSEAQAKYLSVRQALVNQAVSPLELSAVAEQAEVFGDHDLSRSLYLGLARSSCDPSDVPRYYLSLASLAKDAGKSAEAEEYQQKAELLEENSPDYHSSGDYEPTSARRYYARRAALSSSYSALALNAYSGESSSAWAPPGSDQYYERPVGAALRGFAGSSPGGLFGRARKAADKGDRRDDEDKDNKGEHPGAEGGTPGEKPNN